MQWSLFSPPPGFSPEVMGSNWRCYQMEYSGKMLRWSLLGLLFPHISLLSSLFPANLIQSFSQPSSLDLSINPFGWLVTSYLQSHFFLSAVLPGAEKNSAQLGIIFFNLAFLRPETRTLWVKMEETLAGRTEECQHMLALQQHHPALFSLCVYEGRGTLETRQCA